jgi:hypothetical protein
MSSASLLDSRQPQLSGQTILQGELPLKRKYVIVFACLLLLPATLLAQRSARPSNDSGQSDQRGSWAQKHDGAQHVANQINNLSRFLFVLGGVSKDVAVADEAIRNRQASSAQVEQSRKSKQVIRTSIRNVTAGLNQLESDFRTRPALRAYYDSIRGVGALSSSSEQQAASGQLDLTAGSLASIVDRLTNTLLAMTQD